MSSTLTESSQRSFLPLYYRTEPNWAPKDSNISGKSWIKQRALIALDIKAIHVRTNGVCTDLFINNRTCPLLCTSVSFIIVVIVVVVIIIIIISSSSSSSLSLYSNL